MSKKAMIIGGAIVALGLTAYIGLDLFLGSVVTAGVNRFAPRFTQTEVKLAGASLSPLTGSGTLTGLTVGNAKGWGTGPAIVIGQIHVRVAPFSVFGNPIVIDEISIDGAQFQYETRFVSSNIGDLLQKMKGRADSGTAALMGKDGRPTRFEVRRLLIRNSTVKLGVGPGALTLPMSSLELDDLGIAEGGITSDQLALAVMRSMATGVVGATTAAAGKVSIAMGAAAGDSVKRAADAISSLFGGKN